jgi:hypothetical protein
MSKPHGTLCSAPQSDRRSPRIRVATGGKRTWQGGVDDATCAAGFGCLVSSYRKNHDRKKHFYEILKFIFPIDEERLAATPDGTTVKSHTLYSRYA